MIRVLLFCLFVLGLSSDLFADECYQMKNAPGVWKAFDGVWAYTDMRITLSEDVQTLTTENCTLDIELTGKCTKYNPHTGVGIYQLDSDSIAVTDSAGSPTPEFQLRVDPKDPNRLTRTWGAETIDYLRVE